MVDRSTVYVNELPLDTDFLQSQQYTMTALGYLMQAVVGSVTKCDGLACTPSSPASLTVNVGPGSMISQEVLEATSWGSLPADTTDVIMKMGINLATNPFTFVAPSTTGYSQVFLIEGQLQESDSASIVAPYVNASNPAMPWSGPGNSGASQYTRRIQRVALNSVAGVPASTGSQTTPAVTSGWTPLWLVTLANAQTTITSANIVQADGAPFINNKLSELRTVLQANAVFYVSSSGNDANSGRLPTPSSAWQTLTGAWNNIVTNYDLNGYSVTVNLAGSTTFNAGVLSGAPIGLATGNAITFAGAGSSTIIYGGSSTTTPIQVQNGAVVTLQNMAFEGGFGINAAPGGSVTLNGGITYLSCPYADVYANGGTVNLNGTETITASSRAHYFTANGGHIILVSSGTAPTITLSGTPAYSVGFASARGGIISLWNGVVAFPTFSGSATGPHYSALLGGAVDTNGSGGSLGANLPGNASGTVGTGTNTGFYA